MQPFIHKINFETFFKELFATALHSHFACSSKMLTIILSINFTILLESLKETDKCGKELCSLLFQLMNFTSLSFMLESIMFTNSNFCKILRSIVARWSSNSFATLRGRLLKSLKICSAKKIQYLFSSF